MKKSKAETAETRKRIVDIAAREFKEKGIQSASVSEIMAAAGLTHVSVSSRPSFIFARVFYHGHFHEHGHYRGQKHALHQQTLDHYCTQSAL